MLLLVSAVKLVSEIALLALVGRFLLGLLAGAKRAGNPFYGVLDVLVQPFIKLTRLITPRIVLDQHVPLATFFLLLLVWLVATGYKINLCMQIGLQACR
jgi:hypothetical protein